jgi:hypothetical protein
VPQQGPEACIGDIVAIVRTAPVVSLADVNQLRRQLRDGADPGAELAALLRDYCLADPDTRAAFDVMMGALTADSRIGDAFHVQGVYGTGKSHLLAALALLTGHPRTAWPVFLEGHPECEELALAFDRRRLVAAIALDEYPSRTHPLEHVVLAELERALAEDHGVKVALTEESHLLDLVDRYVVPQAGAELDRVASEACGQGWAELRSQDPGRAAQVALEFITATSFPLDWRRSRSAAWAELRRALQASELDGAVIVLDELGLFLASKNRQALNEDASFLQWLAQRTASSPVWLICSTQRGIEEVGDIDRRTLRQLRDRFRAGFTLDLTEIEWIVQHKVVQRRNPAAFADFIEELCNLYRGAEGERPLAPEELKASYPINPLCLQAVRRAAETQLSRTRSVIRLLAEAARDDKLLGLPADRLLTPDVAFDVFRDEMAMSVAGRRQLHAFDVLMADARRLAPGEENCLEVVVKALCFLGVGEVRWSAGDLRRSLIGCQEPGLWRQPNKLTDILGSLYHRGAYVERTRSDSGDVYYVDASSDSSERIRGRLSELTADLSLEDERVLRAALGACRASTFPVAAMGEPRSLSVEWLNGARLVSAVCRDLRGITAGEIINRAGTLASPATREDGQLFLASPTVDLAAQQRAWCDACRELDHRFSSGMVAWLPGALGETTREQLLEHGALASMVADRTLARRRGDDIRERVRERRAASEDHMRALLQRTYYEGTVIAADGSEVIARERLYGLLGHWEETLSEIFAGPFRRLFPLFPPVAPRRRLAGRTHTNQIIDQFIRPGRVRLPPASALEGHLDSYAAPLGLVDREEADFVLRFGNADLVAAALAATPERHSDDDLEPDEAISLNELAGRLAKSEWGLTREQCELLLAALIRTGHLVGLDAFLQPVSLDQAAAPLGDSLPYVTRGSALDGSAAADARALWESASGEPAGEWCLPVQENAWRFFLGWAAELSARSAEHAEAITRAALSLDHPPDAWDWAREALACAEALAIAVDASLSSRDGLAGLVTAAKRLPGGLQQTRKRLADWQSCYRFVSDDREEVPALWRLVSDAGSNLPAGVLARSREKLLDQFRTPRDVALQTGTLKAAARQWLDSYRRHYLAWHEQVHAPSQFAALSELRQSATLEAARRLAQAGLRREETTGIEAGLGKALGQRCLAGDPLPAGHVVCPLCRLALGETPSQPDAAELGVKLEDLVRDQLRDLRGQAEMLRRRLGAVHDAGTRERVEKLLEAHEAGADKLLPVLMEGTIPWLREQLAQPVARRRELRELAERLKGKELTKGEVLRIVAEWLGEEEGSVEVV